MPIQFSNGNQIVHHYDAMGNRLRTTYYTRKVALVNPVFTTIPGTCDAEWQNGGVIVYRALLDDAVLYPNPYITITPQGYTKHYYIGQERIASATGGGRWDVTPDHLNNREADIIDDYWGHYTSNNPFEEVSGGKTDNENLAGNTPSVLQYDCAPTQLFRLGLKWEDDMLSSCINTYLQYSGSETTYFTHNDHLGSASWITDPHGYPVQYIHYAPYGELLANQRSTTFDERYKFTGKERDAESGYDNFGARYYYPPLGIWTRPDPLLDKYLHVSPYMYCYGNPIKYVDPDGRKLRYGSNVSKEFKKQFAETIKFMNSKGTAGIISKIEKRKDIIYIVPTTEMSYFSPRRKTIYWNPKIGVLTKKGVVMSPATVLNHEADHALQEIDNPAQKEIDCDTPDEQYNNAEERRVITGSEQITARKHEEIGLDEVTREDHKGDPYETISPISTVSVNEVTVTASPIKDDGL